MNTIEQDIATQMQLEKADQIVRTREDGWTGQSLMLASLRVLAALSQSESKPEPKPKPQEIARKSTPNAPDLSLFD